MQTILVGKLEGRRPLRTGGVYGRIILKWILGKYGFRGEISFYPVEDSDL
jgi:hypothetical protein